MTLTPALLADLSALRAAATRGPWERESLRQTDTPDRHNEFAIVDPGGRVICDTQNADWTIGEIHTEGPDEDGFVDRWNEPSRRNIEFIAAIHAAAPDLISAAQERYAIRAENDRLREALTGALKDIDDLIEHSTGVAGLHLNGDVAPWSDLLVGGRYEGWTAAIAEARVTHAALVPQEPADHGS